MGVSKRKTGKYTHLYLPSGEDPVQHFIRVRARKGGYLELTSPLRPRNPEEDVTSLCAQVLLSFHFLSKAGAVSDTKYFALEKQERCPEDEIPSH